MNNTSDFNLKKVLPAVLTIAIGMLLVMMDTTIMNVTLPHIQTAFHQNFCLLYTSKSYGVLPKDFRKNNVLFPNLNYMTFNQDKIDNQVFYSDRGSFDILQYYLEKNFEKNK